MPTRFSLFRISVLAKAHRDLFAVPESKEDYIRRVMGNSYQFKHYGTDFHYIPISTKSDYSIGRLGRGAVLEYNSSPSEGFEKAVMPAWRASTIVVDPSDHDDGHKLAMEYIQLLGKSKSILSTMFSHINEIHGIYYTIEINPIVNSGRFYDFVKSVGSPVSFLSISFTPPNGLWSADSSAKEEVQEISRKTKATKIRTILSNKDGLDVSSGGLKESIDYAESGSGSIRAKTISGNVFTSDMSQKISIVEVNENATSEDVESFAALNPQAALGQK